LCVSTLGLATGCALRGDVRKVELQVEALQAEMVRAEASRRADHDSAVAFLTALQRALAAQQSYLVQLRGDVRTDLLGVQQQLLAVQELTGQTQQRLSEYRRRLDDQGHQPVPAVEQPAGPSGAPVGPGAEQVYELSLQQFRRGSFATARLGFREFLRLFPKHELAPDALFYVGETFAQENPDSAAAVYDQVVKTYANSPRAPSALYKRGLAAEQRGDVALARTFFARVVAGYPRSAEANLARDKLQRLGR